MTKKPTPHSLTGEEYREYEWTSQGCAGPYRIKDPAALYFTPGGTTHRVLDSKGIVHILPAPGFHGCVIRVKPRDTANPVQF